MEELFSKNAKTSIAENANDEEARRLVKAANSQFILPAYSRLNEINQKYTDKVGLISEARKSNEIKIRTLISQLKETLQNAHNYAAERQLASIQEGTPPNHLGAIFLRKDLGVLNLPASNRGRDQSSEQHLKQGEKLLEYSQSAWQNVMLKSKVPKNNFWPDDSSTGFGLIVGILVIGSFGASGGAGFGGFLLVGGIFYAAIMILRYRVPAQAIIDTYAKIKAAVEDGEWHANKAQETLNLESAKPLEEAEEYLQSSHQDLYTKLSDSAKHQTSKLADFGTKTEFGGAEWSDPIWEEWEPGIISSLNISFGRIVSCTDKLSSQFPELVLPLKLPALAPFTSGKSLFLISSNAHRLRAVEAVQSLITRLMATIPPGKAFFTFIDPVGLGNQAAAFMPLAEYEKMLVNSQAWTEQSHIEKRLVEITETMESVIQKRLQGRFDSIIEYNLKAEVKEPYRFIIIYDFPAGFTDSSYRRLVSIARNGPKCGVFLVIVRDSDKPLPYGCEESDLHNLCEVLIQDSRGSFRFREAPYTLDDEALWVVIADKPPPTKLFSEIINSVGGLAKEGMRVEVPFEKLLDIANIATPNWSSPDRSTASGIEVPLGPTNDRKPQQLTLGSGTAHHGLIVGRTGSGKSNLMHIIITSIAWKYSPDEIRLYLLDFKKGVEFEPYAKYKLPHAAAVAVESEREFALSVIEQLDHEMKMRDPLFKDSGVNNIADFRQMNTEVKMPRILLLIDEFQELFAIEDSISNNAALLLNRIVLQGRSFGLHVILGTQTLKKAMELTSATFDQMAIRIALQCSDADSRLVLADDNPAARLLSRPGEAIYNDMAGLLEGNNSFQVARFDDRERPKWLQRIRKTALNHLPPEAAELPEPIVFEGRHDAALSNSKPIKHLMQGSDWPATIVLNAYLGEPIAIRPPLNVCFRRQSGNNLLVITRKEEEGTGLLVAAITSLLLSAPPGRIRFGIINMATVDDQSAVYAQLLSEMFPDRVTMCSRQRDIPLLLDQLAKVCLGRSEGADSKETYFLVIIGLHRIKSLRDSYHGEDESSPIGSLKTILREGPESGVHTIGWCDTWPNARAHLDDRLHNEFSYRIAGVMNPDDSRWFIDDDMASKLDENRYLFYDEEKPGGLVKFRPYALPDTRWLKSLALSLLKRETSGL